MRRIKVGIIRWWRGINADRGYPTLTAHLTASSIFRKALRYRNVELVLLPIVNKRIIKLEKKGLYIVLQHSLLEITNHKYSYHLEINHDMYTKLTRMFDQKLEHNFKAEEKIINDQLNDGLKKVLDLFNK